MTGDDVIDVKTFARRHLKAGLKSLDIDDRRLSRRNENLSIGNDLESRAEIRYTDVCGRTNPWSAIARQLQCIYYECSSAGIYCR